MSKYRRRPLTVTQRARQLATRRRVLKAIAFARSGEPVAHAARTAGTTLATIRKYVPTLVERGEHRRLVVVPYDRMKRPMRMLTPEGAITLDIRNSRAASLIAEHANAVRIYLQSGRAGPVRAFRGRALRVDKVAYPFVTDLGDLRRLNAVGELQFEDLYDATR